LTDLAGKTRASSQQADVADARHQLYRVFLLASTMRSTIAIFLGALYLIESLLADRMESCTSDHFDAFTGFMNLGPLLKRLAACESDARLRLLNQEVDCRRQSRNAIH
jgi:hypothetical protein